MIEKRRTAQNKLIQLLADEGRWKEYEQEVMKDEPTEEKRRWELMKKKESNSLSDEEREELEKLQNEGIQMKEQNLLKEEDLAENYFNKKWFYNEKILTEAFGYKGVYFAENYFGSMIFKSFIKDYAKNLEEDVIDIYENMYGKMKGAFRFLAENIELSEEEANSINGFLFEADIADAGVGLISNPKMALFLRKSSGTGNIGMMASVWNKIKNLGKGFFKTRLMPFLKSGFVWAKDLATQGLQFFAANPAAIAIPAALAVFGITKLSGANKRDRQLKKMLGKEKYKEFKSNPGKYIISSEKLVKKQEDLKSA